MPRITYDLLSPMIVAENVSGSRVSVTFRCPVSGNTVNSSATMQQGAMRTMGARIGSSMWYSVRSSLSMSVRSALGYGIVGRAVGDIVAASLPHGSGHATGFTAGEQQYAVVEAFKAVASQFAWDEASQRYISAGLMKDLQPELVRIIGGAQIQSTWDRGVLARMLAEIAVADGQVEGPERQFFEAFVGAGVEGIDSLAKRNKLSPQELDTVTQKNREGMFAMAAALAVADEELEAAEQARLMALGTALRIPGPRINEIISHARLWVVDQLLEAAYADGTADSAELDQVASAARKMGIDDAALERLDISVRRRKGVY